MTPVRLTGAGVLALSVWAVFVLQPGSVPWVGALVVLAVSSWLALGNLAAFVAATAILALNHSDLHGDAMREAVYLPLYVLLATAYLVCRLVLWAPELGRNTGGSGGGDGGSC